MKKELLILLSKEQKKKMKCHHLLLLQLLLHLNLIFYAYSKISNWCKSCKKKNWKESQASKTIKQKHWKMNVIKKQKLSHRINISCLLNNIICKKLFVRKESVFCFKKCLMLVYFLVWLEKKRKSNLVYQKTRE